MRTPAHGPSNGRTRAVAGPPSTPTAALAFVAAVAEGEGADPWGPDAVPAPGRFTERGEPPLPTLSGDVSPGTVSVERGAAHRDAARVPAQRRLGHRGLRRTDGRLPRTRRDCIFRSKVISGSGANVTTFTGMRSRGLHSLRPALRRAHEPAVTAARPSRSPAAGGLRAMGAGRIEVEGPADTDPPALKRLGGTTEAVSWRTRVLVPRAAVLERLLNRRPLGEAEAANAAQAPPSARTTGSRPSRRRPSPVGPHRRPPRRGGRPSCRPPKERPP